MACFGALLADMGREQLVGPEFIGITQILRFLAGAIPHPGLCVIGHLPRLSRSGQLFERSLQPKPDALLDAKHTRAAADAMVPCDRFIAVTGERIEKNRGTQRPPLLCRSRLADRFQFTAFLICELQRLAPPREGHSPLKHFWSGMYRYLENTHLESTAHYPLLVAQRFDRFDRGGATGGDVASSQSHHD